MHIHYIRSNEGSGNVLRGAALFLYRFVGKYGTPFDLRVSENNFPHHLMAVYLHKSPSFAHKKQMKHR